MTLNQGIRVKEVKSCLLCGEPGHLVYQDLRDRLFAAPGIWNVFRCDRCELLRLNPQPWPEDLHKCYTHYYTHTASPAPRFAGLRREIKAAVLDQHFHFSHSRRGVRYFFLQVVASLHPIKERVAYRLMFFPCRPGQHLLDLGCGQGNFLADMEGIGCTVVGVEPDSTAAELAQQRLGGRVLVGTLEQVELQEESFDAITMFHVIEHLHNPLGTLRRCFQLLKPGGKLAIVTPNIRSLAHRLFRQSWRELDPPRHLFLFSPRSLCRAVEREGFRVVFLGTSARSAAGIYAVSKEIQHNCSTYAKVRSGLGSVTFMIGEELVNLVCNSAGEEVGLLAEKPLEIG